MQIYLDILMSLESDMKCTHVPAKIDYRGVATAELARLLKLRGMGTQRVQMKGSLPWLVRWADLAGTRDFLSCLSCSSRPGTKYFFPHRTLFQFIWPHRAQQAGQAAVLGHLSLSMCFCA